MLPLFGRGVLCFEEGCDCPEVEHGQKNGREEPGSSESADFAACGGVDAFLAVVFAVAVESFDAVACMGVELVPFVALVLKPLAGSDVVFLPK